MIIYYQAYIYIYVYIIVQIKSLVSIIYPIKLYIYPKNIKKVRLGFCYFRKFFCEKFIKSLWKRNCKIKRFKIQKE